MNDNPSSNSPLNRSTYLQIVRTALDARELKFAREATQNWLVVFPGDLQANLFYAEGLIADGKPRNAIPILSEICKADPEFLAAQRALLTSLQLSQSSLPGIPTITQTQTAIFILSGKVNEEPPAWAKSLRLARYFLQKKQQAKGLEIVSPFMEQEFLSPLIPITYLELSHQQEITKPDDHIQLLESCHERWPTCIFFLLWLAKGLISWGDHACAMKLLNQAVARDIAGQVANRVWGEKHLYHSLWPDRLELPLPGYIPFKIIERLGWNILPEGECKREEYGSTSNVENEKRPIETDNTEEILKVGLLTEAANQAVSTNDNQGQDVTHNLEEPMENPQEINARIPNYVILSVEKKLAEKFGKSGSQSIIAELTRLTEVIGNLEGWKSILLLADQESSIPNIKLTPARPDDPWSLKLTLADLDKKLGENNERIGAVLIIGGPDIVPFHQLPNPVSDPDLEVPSDNPYATSDDNYFIPEWPVGRIPDGISGPGESQANPEFLLNIIRRISHFHSTRKPATKGQHKWFNFWRGFSRNGHWSSLGYTAAVWESISEVVYSPIGKANELWTSPPYGKSGEIPEPKGNHLWKRLAFRRKSIYRLKDIPKLKGRLAYFNLHGIEDGPEWFGQRDLNDNSLAPDYPIALKPENIPISHHPEKSNLPQIIFSEACYGANIYKKNPEEAICLRFLAAGCNAFVGSTSMSYGSVNTPMIAADLLSHSFWLMLKEGLSVGEAYMRAKIHLVHTMHARQGHLDGEDQKTMLSFVLYGDPLATPEQEGLQPKAPWRPPLSLKRVKAIHESGATEEIPPQVITHVKKIVSRYLPGMADAKYLYSTEEIIRNRIENSSSVENNRLKTPAAKPENNQRITLSKMIYQNNHHHAQVAHLTLTSKGKLIKLAVSR
jgi:hypothetical protein